MSTRTEQSDKEESEDLIQVCYMYIVQTASAWTCLPIFMIGLALLGWTIYQYGVTQKLGKLHKFVKIIYITIYVSLGCYLVKILFAEAIFWIQFYQNSSDAIYQQYSIASQYLFFIDFTGIFAMQSSILLIPTNWVTNICSIFQVICQKPQAKQGQRQQLKRSIIFERVCSKILKYFLIIRLVLFGMIILPYLILVNSPFVLNIFIKIMLIWFSLESISVLIMLVLGVLSLKFNTKLKQIVYEEEIADIQKNYYLLILCTLIRLGTDASYTVNNYNEIMNSSRCQIKRNSSVDVREIINILLEGLLTQYFSIMIILKILYLKEDENTIMSQDKIRAIPLVSHSLPL